MFIALRYRPVFLSVLVMVLITGGRSVAALGRLEAAPMPRTLKAEAELLPQIEQMLGASPTFRKQCERLDDARKLAVLLRQNPLLPKGLFRARSTIHRYSSGLMIVTVEVAPGAGQSEWIAHEFEHVLEMLDREHLPNLAQRSERGVWRSVDGMIETQRAIEAGRTVQLELQTLDASDKYVD